MGASARIVFHSRGRRVLQDTVDSDSGRVSASSIPELAARLANAPPSSDTTVDLTPNSTFTLTPEVPRLIVPENRNITIDCHGSSLNACSACNSSSRFYWVKSKSALQLVNCTISSPSSIVDPNTLLAGPGVDGPGTSGNMTGDPLGSGASLDVYDSMIVEGDCAFVVVLPAVARIDPTLDIGPNNSTFVTLYFARPPLRATDTAIRFHDSNMTCAPYVPGPAAAPAAPSSDGHNIAGILIGTLLSVGALLAAVVIALFLLRRRRRRRLSGAVKFGDIQCAGQEIPTRQEDEASQQSWPPVASSVDKTPLDGASKVVSGGSSGRSSGIGPTAASSSPSLGSGSRSAPDEIAVAIQELKEEFHTEQLQIHDVIAQGGFGTVYKGTWRGLSVAVKTVVFQGVSAGNASMRRAAAEASIAFNLAHPNIVTTYSYELKPMKDTHIQELTSWKLYLIQELCNGSTVTKLLESGALRSKHGGVRFTRVLPLLLDIAAGMEHVHSKRIAHGDLNPNNILLHCSSVDGGQEGSSSGSRWRVAAKRAAECLDCGRCTAKIADFGLSMRLDANTSHISNIRQGTPFYTAPELASANQLLQASDVYSYGVVMWALAHGCHPFIVRDGIFERHPQFPAFETYLPLNYVLLAIACMTRDPRARPTFEQIGQVLADVRDEMSSGAYVDGHGDRQRKENVEFQHRSQRRRLLQPPGKQQPPAATFSGTRLGGRGRGRHRLPTAVPPPSDQSSAAPPPQRTPVTEPLPATSQPPRTLALDPGSAPESLDVLPSQLMPMPSLSTLQFSNPLAWNSAAAPASVFHTAHDVADAEPADDAPEAGARRNFAGLADARLGLASASAVTSRDGTLISGTDAFVPDSADVPSTGSASLRTARSGGFQSALDVVVEVPEEERSIEFNSAPPDLKAPLATDQGTQVALGNTFRSGPMDLHVSR